MAQTNSVDKGLMTVEVRALGEARSLRISVTRLRSLDHIQKLLGRF